MRERAHRVEQMGDVAGARRPSSGERAGVTVGVPDRHDDSTIDESPHDVECAGLHSRLVELAAEAIASRAWEGEGVQSILPTADVDEYVADHWP